jgi:hypothetical protein
MKKTSMSGSLYRLIYCSRNVILQASPGSVTGALLFTGSGFAQVLEGPREVVERTFERIIADPRHADVTVLSFTPTERRCFPDWPMGFTAQIAADADDPLAHLLGDTVSGGPRATTASDVLRLLEKLVQTEDAWVAA